MTRQKLVVGNWKMNPSTSAGAVELARAVVGLTRGSARVGIAPPSLFIPAVAEVLAGSDVLLYAQDVHWEDAGAYTGQLSAQMLRLDAVGSIVGHSEVRRDQGDDDARVARKAAAAIRAGLRVILCLGESLEERERGATDSVLERQVRDGVGPIVRQLPNAPGAFAVAYEPIWAIGTGVAATGAQATGAIRAIRRALSGLGHRGDETTVLYGGSVSANTVAEFATAEGVDGALVGGASLRPEEFAAIVAAFR